MKKTKTFNYLFNPSVIMFYGSKLKDELSKLDVVNAYLQDVSYETDVKEDRFIFVLVKKKGRKFAQQLKKFDRKAVSSFYKGYYATSNKNYAVLVFKSVGGNCFENFINSKYSEMYYRPSLEALKDEFKEANVSLKMEISLPFKVLTNCDTYRKQLIKTLGIEKNPDILTELDSKLNIKSESFDSTKI